MTRELTSHKVAGVNDGIKIIVEDEPGHGGACHKYVAMWVTKGGYLESYYIDFQNGTFSEVGVNGITLEVLLAIAVDRLEGFQSGPFACSVNATALLQIKAAQATLLARTKERAARGVEGTHQV